MFISDAAAKPLFPASFENDRYIRYDCGLGSGSRLLTDCCKADFDALCEKAEQSGYKKIFCRISGENYYNGYLKPAGADEIEQEGLLYVYYSAPRAQLRIVFDPDAVLPKTTPPLDGDFATITQLSLDQTNVDCGMSYVIKCCDNSFFIIDGGYFSQGECDRLYKHLLSNSPGGGKINISGWFFTHAHNDHIGCFMDFLEKYGDKVNIAQILFNFPSMSLPESGGWNRDDIRTTYKFYDILCKYARDIPIIRLHTGQVFTAGNLEFEVIYTHEDLYPHEIYNFNDTSTLLIMRACGKKALWLGDMSDDTSDIIVKTCPDNLKCDIVQVSHHGFNGAKKEIYELAGAKTVFWPTADYRFDENIWRPANSYLLTPDTGRDHLVSGYGTKTLYL